MSEDIHNKVTVCKCESSYSIETHGNAYALYFGRCKHLHGYNLAKISEPAHNFNPAEIVRLLNRPTPTGE